MAQMNCESTLMTLHAYRRLFCCSSCSLVQACMTLTFCGCESFATVSGSNVPHCSPKDCRIAPNQPSHNHVRVSQSHQRLPPSACFCNIFRLQKAPTDDPPIIPFRSTIGQSHVLAGCCMPFFVEDFALICIDLSLKGSLLTAIKLMQKMSQTGCTGITTTRCRPD